ncbi:hypothetical protein SEA_ALAKAZAM_53 [Microbacterium phage Alakazam]|nr:hypothetical protein SEA_ALAKAZAM_53 [Microbacterium phage Alakazam]
MVEFPRTWDSITASALTAIREEWPVTKLERMALEGHPTPACGDSLARHEERHAARQR